MEGGRAGRPVRGALRAVDGPPGEGRTPQAELAGPVPGRGQGLLPPAQRLGHRVRRGVGEHRQHELLAVPEGVAVVAGARQPLGGDGAFLGPGAGLQHMEEREAHRLLDLRVPVHLHIGPRPEAVQIRLLLVHEPLPALAAGSGEGRVDLVPHGGQRADPRPAVGHQLLHPQRLARPQLGGDGEPCDVLAALAGGAGRLGAVHEVVGGRADPQPAALGAVHQAQPHVGGEVLLRLQHVLQRGGDPRVLAALLRQLLVGDQFGLHDDAHVRVQRLHLVGDGGDGPLAEGDQPGRGDPYGAARRGTPLADPAQQQPGAQVQHPLVGAQLAVAHVERLVVDEQPHDLPVGDVDDRLPGFRVAVAPLRVRQRAQLVHPVEIGAGQTVRLALVEVAAPADVPVGECEEGLALRQPVDVQCALAQRPGLHGVGRVADHGRSFRAGGREVSRSRFPSRSVSSARSCTTVSAPCARSASACPVRSTPTT